MIKGIGTDIVQISRIKGLIAKHGDKFLKKILSEAEISVMPSRNPEIFAAGRFAAKEALVKALNDKLLVFSEITIANDESGRPFVHHLLSEKVVNPAALKDIHLSISHEKEYAIAFVVLQ